MARATKVSVTRVLDFQNHRAMAEHYGREFIWHIKRMQETTGGAQQANANLAITSMRMAAWHAFKVLKEEE